MAENSQSFLSFDFQDLNHTQAAAVTDSEITSPHCPALCFTTDLFCTAALFLAIFRAVLHPVWGEPGSAGLDRCLS